MKRILSVAAVGALALTMSACSGAASSDGAQSGDTIKIGVNYELSGAVATYGADNVTGIEMAAEEINAAGGVNGKKIEIVKYDNKSEPAEATTLTTKLLTSDGVVAQIGPACFSDSYQGGVMANYAAKELKAKNAVIVGDKSSDYAKGLAENFKKVFTAAGGNIVDEEFYVSGDQDFNSILTNIKGKSFDVVYIPGYYQEVGLIIKQARALGIDATILGGDGFDSPTLLELAGAKALNNVYFTAHYSSLDTSNEKLQKFLDAYKAKHEGKEPGAFVAMGYDTMYFVADAIKAAKKVNGEAVADSMANYKGFVGVTGKFDVNPKTHDPEKTAMIVGLKDGVQDSAKPYGLE